MARFLTTSSLVASIEELLRNARERVVLVSPYVLLSRNMKERLEDIGARKVKTILVYGKNDSVIAVPQLANISVRYLDNLHAKAYASESEVVLGSMNLFEFSEKNNREMGIHFAKGTDPELFTRAHEEIESILRVARELDSEGIQETGGWGTQAKPSQGACIRCGDPRQFMPGAPFCNACFETWSIWGNSDYPENYCHSCSRPSDVSHARPLCRPCYKSSRVL